MDSQGERVRSERRWTISTAYAIDCDAVPFLPNNWEVVEYRKGGQLDWSPDIIELYLDKSQQNGQNTIGNKLRKRLAGKRVLNSNVLDFLLVHPELIPEEWKYKAICFWGTIYRDSDGLLCVRVLYWSADRWDWGCYWLDRDFSGDSPAALSKPASERIKS